MATYKSIRYNTPISGGGNGVLLSEVTASSSATLSFTSGIDSTYKEYLFEFINIHCETNDKHLTFQCSTNAGSSYGLTLTNTNLSVTGNQSGAQYTISVQVKADPSKV